MLVVINRNFFSCKSISSIFSFIVSIDARIVGQWTFAVLGETMSHSGFGESDGNLWKIGTYSAVSISTRVKNVRENDGDSL